MRPPVLNRKLSLESPQRVPDSAGGYETTWVLLGALWASVQAGTGNEAEKAGLSISSVPYKITVRGAPSGASSRPVAGQRFRDGERVFRVLAVTEAGLDARYLTCISREEEVKT